MQSHEVSYIQSTTSKERVRGKLFGARRKLCGAKVG
jgi:hypothetical protein